MRHLDLGLAAHCEPLGCTLREAHSKNNLVWRSEQCQWVFDGAGKLSALGNLPHGRSFGQQPPDRVPNGSTLPGKGTVSSDVENDFAIALLVHVRAEALSRGGQWTVADQLWFRDLTLHRRHDNNVVVTLTTDLARGSSEPSYWEFSLTVAPRDWPWAASPTVADLPEMALVIVEMLDEALNTSGTRKARPVRNLW